MNLENRQFHLLFSNCLAARCSVGDGAGRIDQAAKHCHHVVFTMKKTTQKIALVLLGSMLAACTTESPDPAESVEPPVAVTTVTSIAELEEAVPENPLKDAYFGETHMHTAMSLDALIGMIGTGNLLPDDAYRLAKGETLTVSGLKHNIGRPLDFAAVTDHAEYIGESYSARDPLTCRPRSALAQRRDHSPHLSPTTGHRLTRGPRIAFGPAMAEPPRFRVLARRGARIC